MTTTHTPGPWRWEDGDEQMGDNGRFVGADGEDVCTFGGGQTGDQYQGDPPSDADRLLIAAAPELLEALTSMVLSFKSYPASPAEKFARAAIAKATGRA